jgi:hypothetical protein
MPKPLPITIEVEEAYAGAVIRALHRMPGIASLHLNLDMDTRPPTGMKLNGQPRKLPKGKKAGGRRVLYELLDGKQAVHRDEIAQLLNPSNTVKNRTTVRNMLYNTMRQGFIKSAGKHHYALTQKGKAQLEASQGDE